MQQTCRTSSTPVVRAPSPCAACFCFGRAACPTHLILSECWLVLGIAGQCSVGWYELKWQALAGQAGTRSTAACTSQHNSTLSVASCLPTVALWPQLRTSLHCPGPPSIFGCIPAPFCPPACPACLPADRAGGSNASLPRDEDRESFAAIAGSCSRRGEAEELVANILGSA